MRLLSLAILLATPSPAAADLLVVDAEGRPVPGLELVLDRSPLGRFGMAPADVRVTTGEDGRAAIPETASGVVDVRSASDEWAVSFLHTNRTPDLAYGLDSRGNPIETLDLEGDAVCVVAPTGTIHLTVDDAGASARIFAVWLDERPEADAHRQIRHTHEFEGGHAELRVPAGRGHLWLAREGELGALVASASGPELVSVVPGGRSAVRVMRRDGNESLILAPFGTIPFERVEALAPDGETVIGDFPFETSPLGLASSTYTPAGATPTNAMGRRQLLRAAGVELQPSLLSTEEARDEAVAQRFLEAPTIELVFSIDVGGKLRLPEVQDGWLRLAQRGATDLYGSQAMQPAAFGSVRGRRPGALEVAPMLGEAPTWSAQVSVEGTDGAPARYQEVLVAGAARTVIRAITDGSGALRVDGLQVDRVAITPIRDTSRAVTVARPADESQAHVDAALEIASAPSRIAGRWKAGVVPDHVRLSPKSDDPESTWRAFGSRAILVSAIDQAGRFDFGAVAPGTWTLGTSDGATVDYVVAPGQRAVSIEVAVDSSGGLVVTPKR